MAEIRRTMAVQRILDLDQIQQEAQHRWLRPSEICEILRNYQKFCLRPDPPVRPPAGSLFLYDRKVLRYFRRDGHRWRKKRDGKTVREAHEKLKIGSVDVLHCYYAHGEDNESFQRRSYWMLEEKLENIVLVHYREAKEGHKLNVSHLLNADLRSVLGSPQTSSSNFLVQTKSPPPTGEMSYASSPNAVDWNERLLISEFEDGDSGEDPGTSSLVQAMVGSVPHNMTSHADKSTGFLNHGTSSSAWYEQKFCFELQSTADFLTHKLIDARLDGDSKVQGDTCFPDTQRVAQESYFPLAQPQILSSSGSQGLVACNAKVENNVQVVGANNNVAGELKKLDSFGRWMDKEIGGDCDDSLIASHSGNYWNTLDTENDNKEVSSFSHHMQLDNVSLGPFLSQEQLFSICDFAPDWAYSGVSTKIMIAGTFLGDKKHSTDLKWCCMFGEIEVSAEVLTDNIIRCQVPFHAPGRVPFYITCSNRLACSEVRDFEYRENPSGAHTHVKSTTEDEVHFLIQLAKMLDLGVETNWLNCSTVDCDKCKLKNYICSVKSGSKFDWGIIKEAFISSDGNNVDSGDVLIENFMKDKLCAWLFWKIHEGGKGPHIRDNEGHGVIHLAAALGYEWAMGLIVAAGVSPNFRDIRGRTALHWASYYGREETVIALVRLGAAPGSVDDPTQGSPGGRTAADLASSRGHKGIAGYLAEADLTSHLSSLTFNENAVDSSAATIIVEKALEAAIQNVVQSERATSHELSLSGSLAAFRKSAHAAALIQASFRARSFNHRQLAKSSNDISEVSLDLVALGSLNKVQNRHFEDYLHSAAMRIQQKYRGWKGRKDFLKIRNRIVKIQAHARGHQVRMQYKKVVWSVSIVEKAILRWRRRRPGLRGFRTQKIMQNVVPEIEKNDEYEFLRIGRKQKSAGVDKALARVQSMVRNPEARDQYMRLVKRFDNLKFGNDGSCVSQQVKGSE